MRGALAESAPAFAPAQIFPASPARAATASASLSVVSFNAGLLALPMAGRTVPLVPHAARRRAALPGQIARLDADVVALQEIAEPRYRETLIAALRHHYPFSTGAACGPGTTGRGLLLLSRHPIVAQHAGPAGMPLLEATVDVPSAGHIAVVTTHLPPRLLPLVSTRARRRFAAALIDRLAGREAILAGDFNAGPEVDAGLYERFLAAGFTDLMLSSAGRPAAVTWARDNPLVRAGLFSFAPAQRIDHLFASPATRRLFCVSARRTFDEPVTTSRRGRPIPLSDHYGVMARLTFRREPPRSVAHGGRTAGVSCPR